MQICLSTILLEPDRWKGNTREVGNTRLAELLPCIAGSPFVAIELWQGHILGLDRAGWAACRAQADALGLSCPVVGAYFNVADPDVREAELAKADILFEAAAVFGARIIKYFAGNVNYDGSDAKQQQAGRDFLQQLLERAERSDITLAAETHNNTFTHTEQGAEWWLGQSASPRHKLLFQTVHEETEAALAQWARQKSDVAYVHLANIRVAGRLDYRRLIGRMGDDGYSGWSCIEFTTDAQPDDPEASLASAKRDAELIRECDPSARY